jgi:hypothetical protein
MSNGKGKKLIGGLISFASGLAGKSNPFVGASLQVAKLLKGKVIDHIEKNKASEIGGEGKTDFAEYAGILAFVVLAGIGLVFVAQGKITFEQLIQLIGLL